MSTNVQRSTRSHYPKKKQKLYQEMKELPKAYEVIALSSMSKVRAAQLMKIRKKFHNEILIKIIKNKVVQKSFENMKDIKGLDKLSSKLDGQCSLMFTNISPFKLNLVFDKNKVYMPAKTGDVTQKDIVVSSGNTGISPGPVLSEFKQANVPTRIDQGTIWVSKDTTVAKAGVTINEKTAALLSKLNIKPIEAGISVQFAISKGLTYQESDLKIDLEKYSKELASSHSLALSLAIESAYVIPETINALLVNASKFALTIANVSNYISADTIELAILQSQSEAKVLAQTIQPKGYTAN